MKIIDQSVEFLSPTNRDGFIKACKYIELAARNCYKSEDKITEDSWKTMIENLRVRKHTPMLEFGHVIIRLITNRGVMAELTRHRLASFAIESTRYCNYNKDKFDNEITVIRPSTWDQYSEKAKELWIQGMEFDEIAYFELLKEGLTPQQARGKLPHDLKTEIIMKTNFTELLHIIRLRTAKDAHPDIIDLFNKVKEFCVTNLSELFE